MRRRWSLSVWTVSCILLLGLTMGCGDWQPQAKPIQPELILEGSVRVDRMLDAAQRYALITRDPAGTARRTIIDRNTRETCDLPAGTARVDAVLIDPEGSREDPLFLLPVAVTDGDADQELYYADERCVLRGPFGRATRTHTITLDQSITPISLVSNGRGKLTVVNPWTEEVSTLAEGVSQYRSVTRPSGTDEPQSLWLIEEGALTQRTFTGELLLSRGEDVRGFEQALYDTLRVAYIDGEDLYEAAGPDFAPVLIAQNACDPRYTGIYLNLYSPCRPRQLVRVDLTKGEPQLFDPGMIWYQEQAGWKFEYFETSERGLEMFVVPPDGERTQVPTPLLEDVQVLDKFRLVGRSAANDFLLWDARAGAPFTIVNRAGRLLPFVDNRTSELLWLLHHDLEKLEKDEDAGEEGGTEVLDPCPPDHVRRGKLSLFSQRTLEARQSETVAEKVPTNGFGAEQIVPVAELTLVLLEDAQCVSATDPRLRGRLRARLLSGELGAVVDEDVTSYVSVYRPLPGFLYSVEDGPRSGLWFAAL